VDQRAAALLEIKRAAIGSIHPLGAGPIVGLLLGIYSKRPEALLIGVVVTAVMFAAIRGGTLLSYEVFSARVLPNRLTQTATGAAAGLVVAFLITTAIVWVNPPLDVGVTVVGFAEASILLCGAIAFAIAKLEEAVAPQRTIFGRLSRPATVATLAAGVGPLLVVAVSAALMTAHEWRPAKLEPGRVHSWKVHSLPDRVALEVVAPERSNARGIRAAQVDIRAVTPPDYPLQLVFDLRDAHDGRIDYQTEPARIDRELEPGIYHLEIREYGHTTSLTVAERLFRRVRGKLATTDIPGETVDTFTVAGTVVGDTLQAARARAQRAQDAARNADPSRRISKERIDSLIGTALASLDTARAMSGDFAFDADQANSVCWFATLAGQAVRALRACNDAVRLGENRPFIVDSRGLAYAMAGQYDLAVADFEKFLSLTSNDSTFANSRRTRSAWLESLRRRKPLSLDRVKSDVRSDP
jgi:hypothetical protein